MSLFRRAAQTVRHLPGLERAEGLWNVLRRPYHRLLSASGNGVEVVVGGVAAVRMPAEYSGANWERYEPESVASFAQWVARHPEGLVLDVGSAMGIYSAVALYTSNNADVIAFDSDLESLAATRRMCGHTSARLRLIYGLVGDAATVSQSLHDAAQATQQALVQGGARGDVGSTRYVCLPPTGKTNVPVRRIDDLFQDVDIQNRPLLLKCDVEGAEMAVLKGAESLLLAYRPTLLLSVHPWALPEYGCGTADIESLLRRLSYRKRLLCVDHEEHWWCEFDATSSS